ncbi:prepilin peptidase [Sphingomonas beigongshangi]|uniref:prepilin peptidase n=1 Tax=Sphingomonas beigongshangi TaxID=2782540 RepID=UPI00193C53BD|nr:A24 family peptidase [Sphingomonas beigongshangi]
MAERWVWSIGLGAAGLLAGSFVAALAVRWPDGRSVMLGRSACDHCGGTLAPRELIPLASFVLQRGRCRRCGGSIAPLHPIVEAIALVIGGTAGLVAPGLVGMAGALFGWLLLALATLDLRAFWLPDRLTGTLAIVGIGSAWLAVPPDATDRLLGAIGGYVSLAGIAWCYRAVRKRDGMGGGDPKLFGAIGLWLGWRMLPAVLVIAALIGLGVALFAHVRGRSIGAATAMPFGALLAAAAYPAWLAMIGGAP